LFVDDVNSDKIRDIYGFHLDKSDFVEITDVVCPYTMHDLIQFLISHSTVLESSMTYQEVKALQLLFMVMSSFHDFGKILELG